MSAYSSSAIERLEKTAVPVRSKAISRVSYILSSSLSFFVSIVWELLSSKSILASNKLEMCIGS